MAALRRKREFIAVRCSDYFDTESQEQHDDYSISSTPNTDTHDESNFVCPCPPTLKEMMEIVRELQKQRFDSNNLNISLKFNDQNIIQVHPTANLQIYCSSSSNCQQFLIFALLLQCIKSTSAFDRVYNI